jgi:plasmid stability protein
MSPMPTLYVRNVPVDVYDQLRRWAEESGRSVNAEALAMLEREVEERRARSDWFAGLLEYRRRVRLSNDAAELAIASIRAHRDAGL